MVFSVLASMTTAMPLPNTSGEGRAGGEPRRSLRGNGHGTKTILLLIGSSRRTTLASNSVSYIQQITIEAALAILARMILSSERFRILDSESNRDWPVKLFEHFCTPTFQLILMPCSVLPTETVASA
jgi:hypothetical protein